MSLHPGGLNKRDSRPVTAAADEIFCFACVRNEELRLPHFLDYHRKLGVDRFFIIDNASEDGSLEFLLKQGDVHVFFTEGSYAASNCGVSWLNSLLSHYGPGHWALTLDVDELLVYPACEQVHLRQLVRFLDREQADGVVAFLLDMYSDTPIRDTVYRKGTPFLDTCRYFDHDTYHLVDNDGTPVRGGPRHRLFWAGRTRQKPSPVLRKFPLVRWRDGLKYEASTHIIRDLRVSALSGVLLHFKFFSDLCPRVAEEVQRGEHWDGAAQYESYLDVVSETPDLTAHFSRSQCYGSSAQLVDLGLMRMPSQFAHLASSEAGE